MSNSVLRIKTQSDPNAPAGDDQGTNMRATNWTVQTDPKTAAKRASGRRRFNAWRKRVALVRLGLIVKELADVGFLRGNQSEIARRLGLHRSTICRDMQILKHMQNGVHVSQINVLKREWHRPSR